MDLASRVVSAGRRVALPPAAWALLGVAALAAGNGLLQVARKPTELLGLFPSSAKSPRSTWSEYGDLFRENSTEIVRPELLAALVQVESSGDPAARVAWRWRFTANPTRIYAPASSAVGILQITEDTFAEARGLCIHFHAVARSGPWYDPRSCWFNALYLRVVPSHAIEITSARLHQASVETLAAQRISSASPEQKQRLAAAIHLCGRARAASFARHGFRARPGERCGDSDLGRYLARVQALTDTFARMDAAR